MTNLIKILDSKISTTAQTHKWVGTPAQSRALKPQWCARRSSVFSFYCYHNSQCHSHRIYRVSLYHNTTHC